MPVFTQVSGRLGKATIALVTITTEEFDGVRSVFGLSHQHPERPYSVESPDRRKHYPIVLRRAPGQTNVVAAGLTSEILEDFRPSYVFVIGTAGGHSERDGVQLGDVVIADYLEYSGYWKLNKGKYHERKLPFDHPSLHLREHFAERIRQSPEKWLEQITAERPTEGVCKALVGEVVAGEILLGDAKNKEQRRLLNKYEKALAFEMESFGIAQTIYRYRSSVHYNPQFLIVRGISDLVNTDATANNDERKRWTPYAINAAATFVKLLIEKLIAQDQPITTDTGEGHPCQAL